MINKARSVPQGFKQFKICPPWTNLQ